MIFLVNKRAQIKNIFIVERRLRILPPCHQTPALTGSNRPPSLWIEPVRSSLSPSIIAGAFAPFCLGVAWFSARTHARARAPPRCIFSVVRQLCRSSSKKRTNNGPRPDGVLWQMQRILQMNAAGSLPPRHPWITTMNTCNIYIRGWMPREKHGQVGGPLKIPVKDKKVNAGSGRECMFLLSSQYNKAIHWFHSIQNAPCSCDDSFCREGFNNSFYGGGKVGLERRSEPRCLIVKSMWNIKMV